MEILKDILQKLSYDELIELLEEYAEKDESFAPSFCLFVASKKESGGEEDARAAVDSSFSKTRIYGRRNRYYSLKDWDFIMGERELLFQEARNALDFGNYRRAVAYPLQWLKRFNEEFTEEAFDVDEEGTEFQWACEAALDIIEGVMNDGKVDVLLKKAVCKELTELSDADRVFADYHFVDIKTFTARMNALIVSPEEALAALDQLICEHKKSEDLLLQKFELLTTMGKEKEAFDFLEDNVDVADVCNFLVDRLMDKREYERALSVLEKAISADERLYVFQWLKKEIEIYELLGDQQKVIAVNRRLFVERGGSLAVYKVLKALIPSEEWKDYLQALMDETRFSELCMYDEGNVKAEILIAENDMEALFQYLSQIEIFFRFDVYSRYGNQLSPERQSQLIPYFVETIRYEASVARKRDHYIKVCQYLSCLKQWHGAAEVVDQLLTEFLDMYRRRPAFVDELKELM